LHGHTKNLFIHAIYHLTVGKTQETIFYELVQYLPKMICWGKVNSVLFVYHF